MAIVKKHKGWLILLIVILGIQLSAMVSAKVSNEGGASNECAACSSCSSMSTDGTCFRGGLSDAGRQNGNEAGQEFTFEEPNIRKPDSAEKDGGEAVPGKTGFAVGNDNKDSFQAAIDEAVIKDRLQEIVRRRAEYQRKNPVNPKKVK